MRKWLLVLMIALLPLRAWVGEAMAGEMMSRHAAMATAVQAQPSAAVLAAPLVPSAHDCAGHGQATPPAAEAAADTLPTLALDGDCPTCASCQACSAVALAFAEAAPGATPFGSALPATREQRFASAEPVPAVKPPIS
jgi:hypothetical protein